MMEKQTGRDAESRGMPPSQGPLVGVRVIDLGTMFAAPFAATLLGDFGADVIKVELPGRGDTMRGTPPVSQGISGLWAAMARNKRSISLDIRKDKGREILKRLIASAHVVIENFRPGTLERWDLGFQVMKEVNPRIVLVRISGYGQTGPYAQKAGFAPVAAAFSGLTFMQGEPGRAPVGPPAGMVDYMGGIFGTLGALMALHHVNMNGGEGQEVDVSLYESVFRFFEAMVADYDLLGRVRSRTGQMGQGSMPSGIYLCRDGKWVSMGAFTDPTFIRLADAMGRPDLPANPRFDTNDHRSKNREEIDAIVREWFSRHTMVEAMELLDRNGVPAAPVNSAVEIFQDPHFKARGNLLRVEHPVLGEITMPGIVPRFSATPGVVRFPGPVRIGEHNLEIYHQELGISLEELEILRSEGVI